VRDVNLAFEPEPGMFVERPAGYLELARRLGGDGDRLGLCLDVGHLLVTGDTPVPERIRELAPRLLHVHLDDIAGGVHEHRMFGEGELDLPGTLAALLGVGYAGLAAVELSRDSHRGAWAAGEALRRLREALGRAQA
jgi:sugar phosphate isomerase/epimerase